MSVVSDIAAGAGTGALIGAPTGIGAPIGAVIGGGAAALFDLGGWLLANGDVEKAQAVMDEARAAAARETPQEAGPSGVTAAGAAGRADQQSALSQLQGIYSSGGLDAVSRARLSEIQQRTERESGIERARTQEEAQRRGLADSGTTLALDQMGGENAVNAAARGNENAAALAEQQRMAALSGADSLSTSMRAGDIRASEAADTMARFNANQRQQSQTDRAAGMRGAAVPAANLDMTQAQRTQDVVSGAGRGAAAVGQGVNTYYNQQNQNAATPTTVEQTAGSYNDYGGR
ncbi:MAG: hypothetical protein ACYC9X_00755 [Dehalococcoidia bacterium]